MNKNEKYNDKNARNEKKILQYSKLKLKKE